MKPTPDDPELFALTRAALDRGPAPPPRVFAAIRAEATRQAALRAARWRRVGAGWRRAGIALGGIAAAALVLLAAWPALRAPRKPAAPSPELPPVLAETAASPNGLEEAWRALAFLVGCGPAAAADDTLAETMLAFQEYRGAFEDAHALYASF